MRPFKVEGTLFYYLLNSFRLVLFYLSVLFVYFIILLDLDLSSSNLGIFALAILVSINTALVSCLGQGSGFSKTP
jgi:hypothetical protein